MNQEQLTAAYRKSLEKKVEACGRAFTIRRPSDAEAMRFGQMTKLDVVHEFVIGWECITEADILSGGDPVPAEFSRELWRMWVDDHPDLWEPLFDSISGAYSDHRAKLEEAAKN